MGACGQCMYSESEQLMRGRVSHQGRDMKQLSKKAREKKQEIRVQLGKRVRLGCREAL